MFSHDLVLLRTRVVVRSDGEDESFLSGRCSLWNGIRDATLPGMAASENGIEIAISPAQVRAGRALLGWSQDQLVERSGVPKRTLARLELGEGAAQRRTLAAIRAALEAAGVEFTNGDAPGVRLKSRTE